MTANADDVSWNLYNQYTTTYTINYITTPAVQPGVKSALTVRASIGNGTASNFEIDTGSAGMVLPQSMIPGFQQAATLTKFEYGSSGNYALGTWSSQTVVFPDSNDGAGNLATATVPVFVQSVYYSSEYPDGTSCTAAGNNCAHMMGVGFGRPDSGQSGYLPSLDSNPLLHFAGMDEGTVRAGYVITPNGIQAGLTAQNAGSGFAYVQLMPALGATAPNWQTTPETLVVNGNAGVGYSFTVGGTDNPDATPTFVRINASGMNTGIRPLSSFTYMFDAGPPRRLAVPAAGGDAHRPAGARGIRRHVERNPPATSTATILLSMPAVNGELWACEAASPMAGTRYP